MQAIACPDCGLIGQDCICVHPVLALCTLDERCQAEADQHFNDCPVERRLVKEFGY